MPLSSRLTFGTTTYGRSFLWRFFLHQYEHAFHALHPKRASWWVSAFFALFIGSTITFVVLVMIGWDAPAWLALLANGSFVLWMFFHLRVDLWPQFLRLEHDGNDQASAHIYAYLRLQFDDAILDFQARHPTVRLPEHVAFFFGPPEWMHRSRLFRSIHTSVPNDDGQALLIDHLSSYPWFPRRLGDRERQKLRACIIIVLLLDQSTGLRIDVPTISAHQLLKARSRTAATPTP